MPKKLTTGELIHEARVTKRWSKVELAKRLGVVRQTIYDWENNVSAPNRFRAPQVARLLDIPLSALGADPMHANVANPGPRVHSPRQVPLINWVNAGLGAEVVASQALATATEFVEVHAQMSGDSFALHVQGHSMEPRFCDGDVIIIDPNVSPRNDDYVVVELLPVGTTPGAGDVTFKQYRLRGVANGSISFDLLPLNPEFPTITVNKNHPGRVVGTVVEHHQVLRR